jgi:hypothetical protein
MEGPEGDHRLHRPSGQPESGPGHRPSLPRLLRTQPVESNECFTGSSQDLEFWSHGLEPITLVLDQGLETSPVDG